MSAGFDPAKYLEVYLSPDVRNAFNDGALDIISQYLITRIVELIPDDQLTSITTTEQLFNVAEKTIPNYEQTIKRFMEEFKKEYKKELGIK